MVAVAIELEHAVFTETQRNGWNALEPSDDSLESDPVPDPRGNLAECGERQGQPDPVALPDPVPGQTFSYKLPDTRFAHAR